MKTEIRDRDALLALSPLDIKGYLLATYWQESSSIGDKAKVFVKDGQYEVIVPIKTSLGDYAERMIEALEIVAKVEGRTQTSVYTGIVNSGSDVIRLRVLEADERGTISLQHGATLFEEARNLMLSAACAVAKPGRSSYHAGKITDAVNYLDKVRLSQTEKGSYVINLLSPVSPFLENGASPLLPSEYSADNELFPRKVTLKLADSLIAATTACNQVVAGGTLECFQNSIQQGINANFCESLSNLIEHGKGLDLRLIWAKTRIPNKQAITTVFQPYQAHIFRSAAEVLRQNGSYYDETILGQIVKLDRDVNDFDGKATIQTLLEGNPKKLKVQFAQSEFNQIINAFQDRKTISIDGDIILNGQRIELTNPRNLRIIDMGSDE
jgi:hypothetical protein